MKKSVILFGVVFSLWGLPELTLASTKAAALTEQVCRQCHSLNRIESKNKTKTSWKRTVERMRKKLDLKGANSSELVRTINQNEAEQIVSYLYSQWGYKSSKLSATEEKRKKLLKQFTPQKVASPKIEERRKKLQEKLDTSESQLSPAEARRKKIREKFPPTKARIVSPSVKTVK